MNTFVALGSTFSKTLWCFTLPELVYDVVTNELPPTLPPVVSCTGWSAVSYCAVR